MELGSTGYYFRGAGEQVHSLGDLGSPSQRLKVNLENLTLKEKPSVGFIFKNKYFSLAPDPLKLLNVFNFILNCSSMLILEPDIVNTRCCCWWCC